MAVSKTVFFKKLVDGSVRLFINDIEGVLPGRWFVMEQNMPRVGVPSTYALSLFVDNSIMSMYKANYFDIEDIAGLTKMAQEAGLISPSDEEVKTITAPKRTKETLLAIIKGGNQAKLEELFQSADRSRAMEVVQEKKNDLSLDILSRLEKIVGVAITEE